MRRAARTLAGGVAIAALAACGSGERPSDGPPAARAAGAAIAERRLTDGPGTQNNPRFSPDGGWIAFDAVVDGRSDLYRLRLADGEILRITDQPSVDRRPAYDPDGRSIVFQSTRDGVTGIWRVAVEGGEATPIFVRARLTAIGPDVSPYGRIVATVIAPDPNRSYGHVTPWVMDADGGGARSVTAIGDEWWARWQPDGEWLDYYVGATDELIAVHADRGARRSISAGDYVGYRPVPSPDGRSLAYVFGVRWDIWIRPLAPGGESLRLTRSGAHDFPDFSPDSRQLVFSRDASPSTLVALDLASGARQRLGAGLQPQPTAGGGVLYLSDSDDPYDVMLLPASGGAAERIELEVGGINGAVLSPSGARIAFSANSADLNPRWNVYVARADGSDARQLTDVDGAEHPRWCGGEDTLFYSSRDERNFWQVFALDMRTGDTTMLTTTPASKRLTGCTPDGTVLTLRGTAGQTGLYRLERVDGAWVESTIATAAQGDLSPDGRRLAFVDRVDGQSDLFIREPDGTVARVTDDAAVESSPRWSADGRRLLFSIRTPQRNLWMLTLPTLPWAKSEDS